MMNDLIERQAAISICDNAIDLWNGQLGTGALVAVRDAIMALPSAQRTGRWMFTDAAPHRVYCSECYKTFIPNKEWYAWAEHIVPRKYCPNCGARMEEQE